MMMAGLELLDLRDNTIAAVPLGFFSDLPSLRCVDLSSNRLTALPDDVGRLSQLQALVLHHNGLTALPAALFALTALTRLDVAHNLLASLPRAVGGLEGLRALQLNGNQLRSLPCEVGWLPALATLAVDGNPQQLVPADVLHAGLPAVRSFLQVVGEQHAHVERTMAALAGGGARPAPHVLDASHGALRALPLERLAAARDALVVLDVSLQRLGCGAWPPGMRLPALVVLNAGFNAELAELPDDFGRGLPALQQLFLASCALARLPASLAECPALHTLFASDNPLGGGAAAWPVLARCTSLATLGLAACGLAGDCDALAGLTRLRFLDVSFNPGVTGLSPRLSGLASLAALSLAFCSLSAALPDAVGGMTALRELNLDHSGARGGRARGRLRRAAVTAARARSAAAAQARWVRAARPRAGVTGVSRALGELRGLESLQLSGCPLSPPLDRVYAKSPLLLVALHDSRLLALDLADAGLDRLPAALLDQTQLTALCLARNALADLPPQLGRLRALRQLNLRGNPLQQPWPRCARAARATQPAAPAPSRAAPKAGSRARRPRRAAGSLRRVASWRHSRC